MSKVSKDNGSGGVPERWAAMTRVSSEEQENKGESLRTQLANIESDVRLLGGRIVKRYCGQEHATGIEERKQLLRLMEDARAGCFDAVMIAYLDRWDRGSLEAKEALEVFKKHGIRFYVSVTEYDLFNPEHLLVVEFAAVISKFFALNQLKKSMLNKIARAKRGYRTCGAQLPYGRTYTEREDGPPVWGINLEQQRIAEDIATRFLSGESFLKLCGEYGISHSAMWFNLRNRAGDSWEQRFDCNRLGIHEVVTTQVPRLLDDKTIKAVRARLEAGRTYLRKPPPLTGKLAGFVRHSYLLGGYIFCSVCGRAYTGCTKNDPGRSVRYYRHGRKTHAPVRGEWKPCPLAHLKSHYVRADRIENAVMGELFNLMGDVGKRERAIRAAIPDNPKAQLALERLQRELQKLARDKGRILDLIEQDSVSMDDVKERLRKLKEREALLKEQLDTVQGELRNVPDEKTIELFIEEVEGFRPGDPPITWVSDEEGNSYAGGNSVSSYLAMAEEDKRLLLERFFRLEGLEVGTKPGGVYLTAIGNGDYEYQLRGMYRRLSSSPYSPHGSQSTEHISKPLNDGGRLPSSPH
jgi:DNA invertase Pin-like site-specific DNA recombinase